jgi:hypothetical protein
VTREGCASPVENTWHHESREKCGLRTLEVSLPRIPSRPSILEFPVLCPDSHVSIKLEQVVLNCFRTIQRKTSIGPIQLDVRQVLEGSIRSSRNVKHY